MARDVPFTLNGQPFNPDERKPSIIEQILALLQRPNKLIDPTAVGSAKAAPMPSPTNTPMATPTNTPRPTNTPMPTPQQIRDALARNPHAQNLNITPEVEQAIRSAAQQYSVPASLLGDIAFQESRFDPMRTAAMSGYDGKTIDRTTGKPYPKSSASGLFQFTDGTWDTVINYANMPGSTLKLPSTDRMDPNAAAAAAAYLIKNGQLGRWDASKGVWGEHYKPEELKGYYSQTRR